MYFAQLVITTTDIPQYVQFFEISTMFRSITVLQADIKPWLKLVIYKADVLNSGIPEGYTSHSFS